jgi:capsular exopolysaccharide synthesis family protein
MEREIRMAGFGGMGVIELLQLLWRRRMALVFCSGLVAALSFAVAASLAPRFTAEGLLLVEVREPLIPELLTASSANPGSAPPLQPRTEASILRSRSLAETVVRELDLTVLPEFDATAQQDGWAGDALRRLATLPRMLGLGTEQTDPARDKVEFAVRRVQRSLDVTLDNYNRIVRVAFTAQAPEVAAAVANTTMERYIANEVEAKRDITVQANRWLTERTAELREDVEAADRRVQDYRTEHALLSVQAGALSSVQLATEQGQLSTARQDVARLQSALDTAIRAVAVQGAAGAAAQEALSSPLIQRLREREAEAAQRLASLGQRLGGRHPDVAAAERELRDLRRQLEMETAKIVDSLRRDLAIARARAEDLATQVATTESSARRAAVADVTLRQLIHDADAKRQVYHAFLTRVDQTQLASAQFPPARIISRADPPAERSGPAKLLASLFGGIGGLFLGAALVLGRHLTRGRVGSAAELMAMSGVPNLGSLPRIAGRRRAALPAPGSARGRAGLAETLRTLRISMQTMAGGGSVTALVTSASRGDGKTMLAASLARVCAADGMRVLLVETDLRRPRLAEALDARPRFSIEALLAGRAAFNDAVHVDERTGLHCLLAAGDADNPQALLESQRFQGLMIQARRNYQLVVLDSPPVLRVADPVLVSTHCDVVLLVVGWERTLRTEVTEAINRFPEAKRARIRTVLNWVRPTRIAAQGYSPGYPSRPATPPRQLPAPAASQ